MKHQNKVVIVTGAAQGLGLACAQRFIAEGARVMLVDVQEDKLNQQVDLLGENAAAYTADLGSLNAAKAAELVQQVINRFGSVDILINNAGVIHTAEFVDFPEEQFDRTQRINLKAPFLIGQAVARAMIDRGIQGAIVNMSSINAELANPTAVAYAVSKGGIKQLTAVMAVGLIRHGIRVNAVGPGTIGTEMVLNSVMASPAQRHTVLSRTPIGRLGEATEVASVVSFLASDEASYMVGQTVYPDGGRLILNYTVAVDE